MESSIQLKHPAGKKAVRMASTKYGQVKEILLRHLKAHGEASHKEILASMIEDFQKRKTRFQGSIEWHMEWVKLDLEARGVISRVNHNFRLA